MPDVPADGLVRRERMGPLVHRAIGLAQALVPEPLPRQHLRLLHQDAPERDEGAVRRLAALRHALDPPLQGEESLPRPIGIDPLPAGRLQAMRAEARRGGRPRALAVAGSDGIVERPLTLAPPHEAVEGAVGAQVILDEGEPELARVGIAETEA